MYEDLQFSLHYLEQYSSSFLSLVSIAKLSAQIYTDKIALSKLSLLRGTWMQTVI